MGTLVVKCGNIWRGMLLTPLFGKYATGFHTEGAQSPPRNLEIEYGFYISYLHVTEHKYVSSKCLEILSKTVSEAIWEDVNSKIFLGGACPQTPLVGTNTLRMLLWSCYYLVSRPHLKILYETLCKVLCPWALFYETTAQTDQPSAHTAISMKERCIILVSRDAT